MQDSDNLPPLPQDVFQQELDKPSSLSDIIGALSPDNTQQFWQPAQYQRGDGGMTFPPATQHGGMAEADFNLGGPTIRQQYSDFDMAPAGNAELRFTPDGIAAGVPGGELGSGRGGHSGATSRTVSPGPGTNQDSFRGGAWQPGPELNQQLGLGQPFSQDF